jgi:hypothetical protein
VKVFFPHNCWEKSNTQGLKYRYGTKKPVVKSIKTGQYFIQILIFKFEIAGQTNLPVDIIDKPVGNAGLLVEN